jgi:hypothetical protein
VDRAELNAATDASLGGLSAACPFHRLETPTQTPQIAVLQVTSNEIWGKAPRGSGFPVVQAYRNNIPAGQRGIEFTTPIAPQKGSGTPYEARLVLPPHARRYSNNKEWCGLRSYTGAVRNCQP